MRMRVFPAGAGQRDARECIEAELARLQTGMLAGEDERRREPMPEKGAGNRCQLYGFGPGADDQPNVGETQPSP
jgi:hypothetical protein